MGDSYGVCIERDLSKSRCSRRHDCFSGRKQILTRRKLHEMSEKFEDVEHEQFGEDDCDDAVKQVAAIEASPGLEDTILSSLDPSVGGSSLSNRRHTEVSFS